MDSALQTSKRAICYHCGLPAVSAFAAEISGERRDFCCAGCSAVSAFIQEAGLESYYRYRDQLPMEAPQPELPNLDIYDDPEYQKGFVDTLDGEGKTVRRARIHIEGMNCSACAWLVEKRLQQQAGVVSARVNYSQRLLFLEWQLPTRLSQLLALVQKLGFVVKPDRPQQRQQSHQKEGRELLLRMGVAGIGMMQVGMYAIASYMAGGDSSAMHTAASTGMTEGTRGLLRFASMVLATLVIFYAAQPFFKGALRSLKSWHLSMDVPVALALGLSYASSLIAVWRGQGEVYFDAVCMFTFFLLVSRYMEFRARSHWVADRDRSSVSDQAIRIEQGEKQRVVATSSLRPGQRILVKVGEVVPVDAELLDEYAELDLAQLTGEFQPQKRCRGDELSSGSINLAGPVRLRVLRTQDQSAMARIESIVSQAEMHRPHIASLADQLAGYFVFALISLALGTYLYWWSQGSPQAFWIALSVLVVGCPCALSLATPTALTVLMRNLGKQGILVQRPEALEVLSKVDRILFDKTGTLTEGRYRLTGVQLLGDMSEDQCRHIASVLESFSNHPLAQVFEPVKNRFHGKISGWNSAAGKGVEARIDGQLYRIGTRKYVDEISGRWTDIPVECEEVQSIYLGTSGHRLAIFSVRDQLRPEAVATLQMLRSRLPGVKLGLFSGDPSPEVGRLAAKLGITDWQDAMTPAGKYQRLKEYQQAGEKVLSVGDGINDAPLLSAADASIALSNAVDLSKNKADFVLLSNNLEAIPLLVDNARRARKIISENLGWALGYNISAIPLAMVGMVPPWLAALGMSASSALVVLNAFRARVRDNKQTGSVEVRVQAC